MSRPPRLGSRAVRLELGVLAFTPALLLLAFRSRHDWLWVCFAVPAVLGCVVAVGAALAVRRASPEPFTFDAIDDASGDVLGYVGSFLIPVVVDTSASTEEIAISALALALIIQIHIVTGRVHVNPLLYLAGYRLYQATTEVGVSFYLVVRSDVSDWSGVQACVPLGSSILVERRAR